MNKQKTTTFKDKLGGFVKRIDTFGTPVSLTYKKDPQIKSILGGFFTLLARLAVGIYLIIQCLAVINKTSIIQTSLLKRDLTMDTTESVLTTDNFDYGIRLEYIFFESQPEIQENLDQYVYLQISQNVYTWVKDKMGISTFNKQKEKTELGSCTNGRLGLTGDSKDFLSLRAGYQCPTNVDYRMKGSFSGEQSKFIQVRVGYCNQTYLNEKYNSLKKCKTMEQMNQVAANLKLYFVIQNSYFDTSDFSGNPIKKYLKPYYLTSKNNTSQYYYMALSQNVAMYNDNALYGTPEKTDFIETRIDYQVTQEIPTSESTPNAFIAVYIQMDDGYKVVSRKVTTFIDALQTTGGFMTVIFVVIVVIIQRFQKTIYATSLIKSFYKYQQIKPDGDQDESLFSEDSDEVKAKSNANKVMEQKEVPKFKDKQRDRKIQIYQRIIDQISTRKKLIYGLTTSITSSLKKCLCKKMTKKEIYKNILYRRGQQKIEKELDIRNIAKQLKMLKFLAKVTLTKYQRHMIQFFKDNLLNNKNEILKPSSKKDRTSQLEKYLFKTVENCNTNKMDGRMLKNVLYSEDDEILDELTKQLEANQEVGKKVKNNNSTQENKKKNRSLEPSIGSKKREKYSNNFDDLLMKQSMKTKFYMDLEEMKEDERITENQSHRNTVGVAEAQTPTATDTKKGRKSDKDKKRNTQSRQTFI